MSAPASAHASLRAAFEREFAAALIDIARRPGRLTTPSPLHGLDSTHLEVTPTNVTPTEGKKKAPVDAGAQEILRPDRHSRKA